MYTHLFVYGTLLPGEANHHLLAGSLCLGAARTQPAFQLFDLGAYPALIAGGSIAVEGEIYAVDSTTMDRLDALEDIPHLYQRHTLTLVGGQVAEVYLMPEEAVRGYPRISSGDWRRHRRGE